MLAKENKMQANKNKIAYIRLDKEAEEIIATKISETGLSQSGVIRMIIHEWAKMKKQFITIPIKDFVNDAGVVRYNDPADKGEE
jgi:antitoxin component of RelBE/YafQ-DinJ toxin-antitoxin module